jgi:mono/diheme cytochrome c family protein
MKNLSSLKPRLRAGVGLAVVAAVIYVASIAFVTGADTKTGNAKPAKKAQKSKLTGAELYAVHCNRCHAERYATERTDAQWKTLMMHMQVRAQLPGADAKAILKYLQENN